MEFSTQKLVQMINFFAVKNGGEVDYVKALKLIYLSDKYMLCRYGRMITYDNYAAMKKGPVPTTAKTIARGVLVGKTAEEDFPVDGNYADSYLESKVLPSRNWQIKSKKTYDEDYFSDAEIETMDFINGKFSSKDTWDLCELTHEFYEWKKHNIDGKERRYAPMRMVDFFVPSENIELNKIFGLDNQDLILEKKNRYINFVEV